MCDCSALCRRHGQTCPLPLGSLLWPHVNWSNWELTHLTRVILLIIVKGKLHHWEDPLCISVVLYQVRIIGLVRMPGSLSQWKHEPLARLPAFVLQAGLP